MLFVLILLNLIFITSTTDSWHQLDGIEYYFEYTAVSISGVNGGCVGMMDAILAVVKSQRIQDFLVKNINTTKLSGGPYAFYIGLSRTGPTTLEWSDGTTTDTTSVFTYWDGGDDVYDSRKLCVTMGFHAALNGFKWKIEECSGTYRYICQRNTPPTTTTSNLRTTTKLRSTTTITKQEPTTTESSFASGETPTTDYKDETTIKDNYATMDNLKSYAPTTPSWVIPVTAILSATVVFMLALVLYLWKRLSQSTVRTCDVNDNMDMTQASGHITPYATTSGYQQQYENMKAAETAYEEFNGK